MVLPETTSTNRLGLELAEQAGTPAEPDLDGLAIVADYQTAGRGRHGRSWLSPRGASVLCSVLVVHSEDRPGVTPFLPRPVDPTQPLSSHTGIGGWLTIVSAVAACEAVRHAAAMTPSIKWPNDLRISGRKLGGVLIESRALGRIADQEPCSPGPRAWVIGIGINCLQHPGHFPPDLRDHCTSLEIEATHPIDRVAVARELLRRLDGWLAEPTTATHEAVHAAWLSYAEPTGQRVRLQSGGREYGGTTIAVDPTGGLIVQGDDGRREWFDPMLTTLL